MLNKNFSQKCHLLGKFIFNLYVTYNDMSSEIVKSIPILCLKLISYAKFRRLSFITVLNYFFLQFLVVKTIIHRYNTLVRYHNE